VSALSFRLATEADLRALLELRLAIDADQAERFGDDRYATTISEKGVARSLKSSRILVATRRGRIVGLVSMGTKKPWAVDLQYFTPACKAVYLYNVDVSPDLQRSGIGRQLIDRVKVMAKEWTADAIRLDAYDGAAGAGPFYKKCGFKKLGHNVYRGVPLVYYEFVL
jgi:ribosomal protein S18 acetylase RimI-like enzyme